MIKKVNSPKKAKLMGRMKIWFYREKGFGAMIDRFLLDSYWNKVGIEINGNITIVDNKRGVMSTTKEQLLSQYPKATFTFIPVPDIDHAQWYIDRQLNKPDDTSINDIFNKDRYWTNDDSWSGAELAAEVLRRSGIELTLPKNRVTPADLWSALPIITFNPNSAY